MSCPSVLLTAQRVIDGKSADAPSNAAGSLLTLTNAVNSIVVWPGVARRLPTFSSDITWLMPGESALKLCFLCTAKKGRPKKAAPLNRPFGVHCVTRSDRRLRNSPARETAQAQTVLADFPCRSCVTRRFKRGTWMGFWRLKTKKFRRNRKSKRRNLPSHPNIRGF